MGGTASFTIGKVTGVHGLGGNLKIWSYAQSPDTFRPGRIVLLQPENGKPRTHTIIQALPHKKGLLLKLEGIDSRDEAETQIGSLILMDREQLPEPEENSWYWEDLIGLEVMTDIGENLGSITQIFPTGAHDILVVEKNGQETLIPMHEHFVKSVDTGHKMITVCLPEGF